VDNEVRIPDLEVIIGASGDDLCVFAFYRREDIHDGYEIISCIAGKASRPVVRKVLQDCIEAINTESWYTLEQLHSVDDQSDDKAPF